MNNKNLVIIFLTFVLLPILISYLNLSFSSPVSFSWGNNYEKQISVVALVIGIIALVFISIRGSVLWKVISIPLILLLITWLYLGLSFSFEIL